jgi:hypothetical protein
MSNEAEKFDCRLLRELYFLVKAANAETDLRERLARLERIADMLESFARIEPQMDSGFWFDWISRRIDALQEQLDDLYDDDWQGPALLRLSTIDFPVFSRSHFGSRRT